MRMESIFTIALILAVAQAHAIDKGPVVFSLTNGDLGGSYLIKKDQPKLKFKPGDGGKCSIKVTQIVEHRAPKGYKGWYLTFTFTHPDMPEPDKIDETTINFFWDGVKYDSPFQKGFKENYSFLDGFASFPSRREASFNSEEGHLKLESTDSGNLVRRHLDIAVNPGLTKVRQIKYRVNALGSENVTVTCTGEATIENGKG